MRRIFVHSMVLSILLASCGEMPFYRSGATLGRLSFVTNEGSSRTIGKNTIDAAASARMVTDSSMDYVSDFYSGYGTLVGTYTPTSVVLPIQLGEILLNDEDNPFGNIFVRIPEVTALDDPAQFLADFGAPIVAKYMSLPQGTYDRLELRFMPGHGVHVGRGDPNRPEYTTWTENRITVDLPGYGGIFPDIPSRMPVEIGGYLSEEDFSFSFSGDFSEEGFLEELKREVLTPEPARYFERNAGDGDTYNFTLQYLFPRQDPGSQKYQQTSDAFHVQWHVFTSRVSKARTAADREYDTYNTDTLLMPLEPIKLSPVRGKATIVVSLDTKDLIEVYDNSTPGDYSDDIVVLADKYWERFSVSLVYEE
jgi:hypothetical protein